jgi:hypothetical protein
MIEPEVTLIYLPFSKRTVRVFAYVDYCTVTVQYSMALLCI